jgi:small-conductance mechanosensitive channel
MRRYANYLLLLFALSVLLYALFSLMPIEYRWIVEQVYVKAAVAIVIGVVFIEYIAGLIKEQAKSIGPQALLVRNIFLIFGYIILGVVVAAILGVSGESILASATFSGLIIGLGMQPVLANFFAGIIILGTGFLKPGRKVKLASTSVPINPVTFPAYKAFSRDIFIPTVRGTIVEIGFMYTKILLETGELIKIANSMIFSGAVVFEEEESIEPPRIQVRYEFPIEYEPSLVLTRVRDALSSIQADFEVYVEEQSDKNYYIILVVANVPHGVKVREFRSRILEKIIKVHRELTAGKREQ